MNSFHSITRAARRANVEAAIDLSQRRAWYAPAGAQVPMTEAQYQDLTNIQPLLRKTFYDQLQPVVDQVDILSLFNMQDSTEAQEVTEGVGGFSNIPVYNGTIPYESFELLYRKTYTPLQFARGVAVTRQLVDDDRYNVVSSRIDQLGLAFQRTIYADAVGLFVNAANTSYTRFDGTTISTVGGDAVALASTSHPYSPTDAGVQSNTGTAALTYDNVIAARTNMRNFKDSKHNPMLVEPDILLVPTGLSDTADKILQSPGNPDTANRAANTVGTGGLRKVMSRYLTDSNDWFLIDSRLAAMYLNFFWRVRPEFVAHPVQIFDLEFKWRGYMRYSLGFDHWCWLYANIVA